MTPTPTQKSFTLATSSGPVTITMRKPTPTEVLAYADKRSLLKQGIRPSADACDDGDYELLACVTSPSAKEMDELLNEYPFSNTLLRQAFDEMGGSDVYCDRDDALATDEHRKAGSVVAFSCGEEVERVIVDGKVQMAENGTPKLRVKDPLVLVLTKLSRYEAKALDMLVAEQGRKSPLPSEVADLARRHVVARDSVEGEKAAIKALLDDRPAILPGLGFKLLHAAQAKIVAEQGKS